MTGGDKRLQGVTGNYKGLPGGCKGLYGVTMGYRGSRCYSKTYFLTGTSPDTVS